VVDWCHNKDWWRKNPNETLSGEYHHKSQELPQNIEFTALNLNPAPPVYLYLDVGVSRVGGIHSLNDARVYAGGSLASGTVTLARQGLVERPD